jgi:Cof subfamily protein (haloacid dehalogenase superfamily)
MVMGERPRVSRPEDEMGESLDRVRLMALDLDGTVLSPTGHVTPRTRAAIRRLIESGISVCIATGRSWWESRAVIDEGALLGPGVFVGGAVVNDMPTGKSLSHTRMIPALARAICGHLHDAGVAAMVMQDHCHADCEWLISEELEMPPSVPEWLTHHASSHRRVAGLTHAAHDWTLRVGTVTRTREEGERVIRRIAASMGDQVYFHQITVPTTGISVLEVFDVSVNKWHGVRQVAGLLGIGEHEIVAVGDDMNDLHMLRHARLGVAMGNARPEVMAVADRVIGSNAVDGLAIFLEAIEAGGGTFEAAAGAKRDGTNRSAL